LFRSFKGAVVDYYINTWCQKGCYGCRNKISLSQLAREHHPDLNNSSEKAGEEFALISQAYRTLSDSQERDRYDIRFEKRKCGFRLWTRIPMLKECGIL